MKRTTILMKTFLLCALLAGSIGAWAATEYTIAVSSYDSSKSSEGNWVFTNGFALVCSGQSYGAGSGTTDGYLKMNRNKTWTVNIPSGLQATKVKIMGWSNKNTGSSTVYEINEDTNQSYTYPNTGNDRAVNEYTFASPVTGSFTFKTGGDNQLVLKIIVTAESTEAATPSITSQSVANANYAIDAAANALSVTSTISSGTMSYQWYNCDNAEKENPVAVTTGTGGTTASFTPSTASAGMSYYFCRVSNASDATKYVDSNVATINVVADYGKSTWDLSSIEASDISSNTTFWELKEGSTDVYYVVGGATADVRIALENNNGFDMVQGIKFYRAGKGLANNQTTLYIGRGFCMMGSTSSHVEIPVESGKYYRITHARGGSSGTYGYSISSGATYQSGDLTYAFTNNTQRGSFIVRATADVINLACTDNSTTLSKVEQVEVLTGVWSRSSDEFLLGATAPSIPTLGVTASDAAVLDGTEYTVAYSLKEGSTDGIVEVNANTGITAINNNVVGTATVVATLTSTSSYGIATEKVEYVVTVNARTNTTTTFTAAVAAGTKAVIHNEHKQSDNKSAVLNGVATIYDYSGNTGVQGGSTQTFTVNGESGLIGLKLSGSRRIAINPATGVTISSVKCYVRSNSTSTTNMYRRYTGDKTYTEVTEAVVDKDTSTPTEIDLTDCYQYGFAFSAQVQAVFLITYSRAAVYDVTIKETGYATLYTDAAVAIPDGVQAFYGTLNAGKNKLLMNELTDNIPANTAVILKTETPGKYSFIGTAESVDAVEGNVLKGQTTDKAVDANTVYTLGMDNSTFEVGMCLYTGTSVRAYSAYMDASDVAPSRIVSLSFENVETGIKGVAAAEASFGAKKFLENGRLVIKNSKGKYTVSGIQMR